MAKAILDLDVEPGRVEDAVNNAFEPRAVDVVEFIGSNDLRCQICRSGSCHAGMPVFLMPFLM